MRKQISSSRMRIVVSVLITLVFITASLISPRSAFSATSPLDSIKSVTFLKSFSEVRIPTPLDGVLYFMARESLTGLELWRSEGTPETTRIVKNLNGTVYDSVKVFTPVLYKSLIYFIGCTDAYLFDSPCWLYSSDGTAAGTNQVIQLEQSNTNQMLVFKDELYFTAGNKLRKTDGTTVTLVGTITDQNDLTNLVEMNGKIYFGILDLQWPTSAPFELWSSDGTSAQVVKSFPCAGTSGTYMGITAFNNLVFFQGCDSQRGGDLWQSDGTPAGTVPVVETPSAKTGIPGRMMVVGDWLYVALEYDDLSSDLFRTKGRAGGTELLQSYSKVPWFLDSMKGSFYYSAPDAQNVERVWQTDGTPNSATLFNPTGDASAVISSVRVVGEWLFFTATTPSHGSEVWMSDGTPQNTVRVTDLPASASGKATAGFLTPDGLRLYFTYRDPATSTTALHMIELSMPPPSFRVYLPALTK